MILVLGVVLAAGAFAMKGAMTDSVTVDEPSHVIAGYAALTAGDYRLSPDHPPLGRILLALPLLAGPVSWRAEGTDAWRRGDFFVLGKVFLEEWNDGQSLIRGSRAAAILSLMALLATIGGIARAEFGTWGGLLAMTVAAFDPALLAHGHLATMDVPFTLCALLTLLCCHRWLDRPTGLRLAALVAAFSAATLVKFSWPALVPAIAGMVVLARRKRDPRRLAGTLATAGTALAIGCLLAIWAAYGFRFEAAGGKDSAEATMHVVGDPGRALPTTRAEAWESVLHDPTTGVDRRGPLSPILRFAHSHRLLPEAYLYGIAYVAKKATVRAAYLRGRYSMTGFKDYFFWAFLVKTPVPTLLLVGSGVAVALLAALRGRGSPLTLGLALFSVSYLTMLLSGHLNLGYRHLLPVTAVLFCLAGGLVAQSDAWRGMGLRALAIAASVLWLGIGTWRASPYLLGFFNEPSGGASRGHLYLADSNLDWGQDLLRLDARLRTEAPGGAVWLAQAGDPPWPSGLAVRALLGDSTHAPDSRPIAGGLYVLSVTEWLGVYRPLARAAAWQDPRLRSRYDSLAMVPHPGPVGAGKATSLTSFEALRRLRLIAALSTREPDERIGTSLFLFRLSDDAVDAILAGFPPR